jgi:SAM-dependent methyltransferase
MTIQDGYKERYMIGDTPWDVGRPEFNLVEMLKNTPIRKGKVLEIGCGTGTDTIWLAKQHFLVTGVDISKIALQKANNKALEVGVKCTFLLKDFLKHKIPGTPFNFVFDRGCFHAYNSVEDCKRFAKNAANCLEKEGLWLSIVGGADDPPIETGLPRRTAKDIVVAVEQYFEILSLNASHFESNRLKPPKVWVCLMRKRDNLYG